MVPLLLNKAFSALGSVRRRYRKRLPRPYRQAEGAKTINLALQGGGAHGAFTWGVLDALLSDGRLAIDGISGASAGAVNAVVLADGLERGGAEVAKARLAEFWHSTSLGGNLPPLQRGAVERLFSFMPRAGSPWLGALSQLWSPYDLNPLNINLLKDLIERSVDFNLIRHGEHELFVAATQVRTGKLRVFTRKTLTASAVTASACIPLLFRAVEIDGEAYWDGGYSGNPPLCPFLRATATEDVLIVQINPIERRKEPVSAPDIRNRVHEITFNAPLLAELRALDLAGRMIEEGGLPRGVGAGEYRRLRFHRIVLNEAGESFDLGSKLNTDFDFLERLRALGDRAARHFLDDHFDDIGSRSTIGLRPDVQAELV